MPGIRVKVFGVRRGGRATRGRARVGGIAFVLLAQVIVGVASLLAVPAPASAYTPRAPILIVGNAAFTAANGVTGGNGTPSDPYVIEGWEIDASAADGIAILYTTAHFIVRNVRVHSGLWNYVGVWLEGVQNGRIEGSVFADNADGVYVLNSADVTLTSNTITGSLSDGIRVDLSTRISLVGNDAQWNQFNGVSAYETTALVLTNNVVSNNDWGVYLWYVDSATVEGNNASANIVVGIGFDLSANATATGNQLWDNDWGFDVSETSHLVVRENTVGRSTSDAVAVTGGTNLTFVQNTFVGTGGGLMMLGATNTRVYHNAFLGNTIQAADDPGANAWDDGYPSGGNYWSDYAGVDNCSGPNQDICPIPDEIGDTPYGIDADSQDRYPLMQPYVPGPGLTTHAPIVIVGNAEFTGANGVTGGSGTPWDPYIIEGWEINASVNSGIEVYNTDAHFVIRNVYIHSALIDGIYFYSVQNGRVWNASLTGNRQAFYVEVSSTVTVAASNISFNVWDAIVLDWSSNVTLEGNSMWGNGMWGVFTYAASDLAIRNNTVSDNDWGIDLVQSQRIEVAGNEVASNNVAGLSTDLASNVTVIGNAFRDNDYNVNLTNSTDLLFRGNAVDAGTSGGVTIAEGVRVTLEENNITGNPGGILVAGTSGLTVRHNQLDGNALQASDDAGSANAWDDGYPSGGNFWSNYTGVDDCSGPNQDVCPDPDGIGDTPYVIDADSQDRYPLVSPPNTAPVVTVLAPNGGENWAGGSTHGVEWTMGDTEDGVLTVAADLSTDGGITFPLPMFSGSFARGTNTYAWTLPPVNTTTARVRVCVWDSAGASACDASDGDFTISVVEYRVDVIPPLPGDLYTVPLGINGRGDVVGWSWNGQRAVPFLFTDAAGTQALPALPGRPNGTARDINEAGQIVGSMWAGYLDQPGHAVRWTAGAIEDLGTLGGVTSEAWGLNATGAVVGTSLNASGTNHAFLFTDQGGMIDLTPDNDTGAARDINDAGQVAGYRTGFGGFHVFRWSAGTAEDLGSLSGFANGYGFAINAAGQVAGSALSASGNSERFIRFTDGAGWQDLGGVGQYNAAWGINRFGDVVGVGVPSPGGLKRAVRFTDAGGLQDLNPLVDPALQLFLLGAFDINDPGQIVATAFDNTIPGYVGIRLTPQVLPPRPPTIIVVSPNGGEDWTGGSAHAIAWTMDDAEDPTLTVTIDLSIDGGVTFMPLFGGTLPIGLASYTWTLPLVDTTTAVIRVCVFDSGGLSACDTSDGFFTIDSTRPVLIATQPSDGASDVDPSIDIVLTFSEPMNRSETEAAVAIAPTIAMSASWDASSTVLTLRPTAPLANGTTYAVTIGCGAEDDSDSGNVLAACPRSFSFSSRIVASPPAVTIVAPSGGERWTGGTPHAISWTMSDTTTPGDLVADLDYSADGGGTWVMIATGVIRPQGLNGYTWLVPLIDATGVNVRVCASDGALRACSTSPGFRVDSTPPAVIATVPQEGVSNVAVGQPLVITFSEAIDTAAFPPSGVRIFPPVTGLTVAWSSGLQTLTVAHSVFAPCTMYTARVDAAEDGSDPGIPIPFVYSWSFSTVCTPAAAFLGPLGGEDWTGGSTHVVRFRVTDEADAQVWAWLNATIDGTETALYAGLVAVGETALSWTIPVSSGTARLRLEVVDSSALTATAMTGAFEIDATPPTLLSTEPTDGLSGVQVGAPLILTFSERMNATATQSAIRIAPPAGTMDFTWGAGFSVLIIRFAAPLAVNTSYVLAVGCEALDDSDSGNPVAGCPAATTEIAFRTEPAPPVAAAVADVDVRVGVLVTFDGRGSTGAIMRYEWTIRDTVDSVVATLQGPVVTHTFANPGTHTVTLQVTDMFGRTDEYRFDVTVHAVVGVDGGGWMLVLVGALATATILFTTSEPGRVALMTATVARAYGRRGKDEKDSELRGAMLYYVRVHPGDCYMDIKRNLDLNDGVVTYHLARLEKEGLIRSAIRGARKRYYPAEMRVPLENGGELHAIQQRILQFVGEAPGVPVAVLAEQLGVSNQLALYHLRKLSQGQRVELERAGLRLRAYPGRTEE